MRASPAAVSVLETWGGSLITITVGPRRDGTDPTERHVSLQHRRDKVWRSALSRNTRNDYSQALTTGLSPRGSFSSFFPWGRGGGGGLFPFLICLFIFLVRGPSLGGGLGVEGGGGGGLYSWVHQLRPERC